MAVCSSYAKAFQKMTNNGTLYPKKNVSTRLHTYVKSIVYILVETRQNLEQNNSKTIEVCELKE